MAQISKIKFNIIRGLKTIRFWSYFTLLLILMLLGAWCLPPKWFENILNEIKAKYTVEKIIEEDD
jgi:hypothetical protein